MPADDGTLERKRPGRPAPNAGAPSDQVAGAARPAPHNGAQRRGEWIVDVQRLKKAPGTVIHEERAGTVAGLRVLDVRVPDDQEIAVSADLSWAQEDVVVTATVRATWVSECRRCLKATTGEVVADVREVYEPKSDHEETYALSGAQVDLEPLVRDAVLLGLPAAPLCEEGCQGLCPTCGTDLNDGPCGCESSPADPRWAALDALRNETE